MSLRDELVRTFHEASSANALTIGSAWMPSLLFLEMVADECIRQMDYNARRAFDSCCNRGELDQNLTIAPEGWKP